jgi:hypothetical protein
MIGAASAGTVNPARMPMLADGRAASRWGFSNKALSRTEAHQGDTAMKKAIFAMLTVLGVSLATGAFAPTANAYTYLFTTTHADGGATN